MGVSAFEYRLKTRTQRAELDINLARLFSELVPIASGSEKTVVSEAAVAALMAQPDFTRASPAKMRKDLHERCVVTPVTGANTQAAAIASLGYLGRTYPALREPATVALEGLSFVTKPSLAKARDAALCEVQAAKGRKGRPSRGQAA